jgi:HEPN domain-containing protein
MEKSLQAVLIARAIPVRRTHSIQEITNLLAANGLPSGATAEECNLLEAIYLPSKYPLGSPLPDFAPDEEVCRQCVQVAERVAALARQTDCPPESTR